MCFSKVNETAIALPGLRQKHILLAQCGGFPLIFARLVAELLNQSFHNLHDQQVAS